MIPTETSWHVKRDVELQQDFNTEYQLYDLVWIGVSSVLVWLMIPGVGLLYSGLSRKKHALSLLWASIMASSLVTFQWFFWGYSLAFSHKTLGNGFIGTLQFFCFKERMSAPSVTGSLPDIIFALFQGMFATVTGTLMVGGACERARLFPMMVFLFLWITIVYCPIACWTWNSEGWLEKLGALDFAGGGPVHITSGHGALMYALVLGKRNDPLTKDKVPKYMPHSVTSVVLGTVFLWFGWFGFNGGSTGNASLRTWYACVSTNVAAASGGLTWMFIDYFRFHRKWTTLGLCMGAIAGLVGVTPAAGFVPVWAGLIIGIVTAAVCNFAVDIKTVLKIDDGLDVYALHGVGGVVGSVLTGIFAKNSQSSEAGIAYESSIDGGWLDQNYKQIGYQFAAIGATIAWSSAITFILLIVLNQIPFLRLRLKTEEEEEGTDAAQIGEFTYTENEMYIPEPTRSKGE